MDVSYHCFYTDKPTATTQAYDKMRHSEVTFVAPVTGWIAFNAPSGYKYAQIAEGSYPTPYVPHISATDFVARTQGNKLEDGLNLVINPNDKVNEIVWINGYRVIRANEFNLSENADFSIANITVKQGDLITIDFDTAMSDVVVPIARRTEYNGVSSYRALVTGTSKHYRYIVETDTELTLTVRNAYHPVVHWYSSTAYAENIASMNDKRSRLAYSEYRHKLSALATPSVDGSTVGYKPLTLVHFSDIHGIITNIANIKMFRDKYEEFIDDVIVTGDLCSTKFPDYRPIYNEDGYNNFLLGIGNHDVYDHNNDFDGASEGYSDPQYWATPQEKYNQFIKPNVANWGVVQPSNAETNGLCYYYKDYPSSKVRLIMLDAMAFDSAQYNWLESVLATAKQNNLTVVIGEHFPPTDSAIDTDPFSTNFSSLSSGMEASYGRTRLAYMVGETYYKATDLVDNFISDGGDFACWLCGHLHYAQVGTLKSHPNQIYIAVELGSTMPTWRDTPRDIYDKSEDLFNVVGIDTTNKTIKVLRIGAEYDDHMRHRGTMSIDYANRKLLASE